MRAYLFRLGDGNEGNYPQFAVTLSESDNPYAALAALVANRYIAGKRVRKHIMRNVEIDGEADYGIHATVYEGPEGEQAFGAAWLTAELQPLSSDDAYYYGDDIRKLPAVLDRSAKRFYKEQCQK